MLRFLFLIFVYVIITRTIMAWFPYDKDPHPNNIDRFIWAVSGEFCAIGSGIKSMFILFRGLFKYPVDTAKAIGLAIGKFLFWLLKQAFDPYLNNFTRTMFQLTITYSLIRSFCHGKILSVLLFVVLFAVQYIFSQFLADIAVDLTWDSRKGTDIESQFYFWLCRIYQTISNRFYDYYGKIQGRVFINRTPDEYVRWIAYFRTKRQKREQAEFERGTEEFNERQKEYAQRQKEYAHRREEENRQDQNNVREEENRQDQNNGREEENRQDQNNGWEEENRQSQNNGREEENRQNQNNQQQDNRQQQEHENKTNAHRPTLLDYKYPKELKVLGLYCTDFTMDELKHRYKNLIKKYHPDNANTPENIELYTSMTQEIIQAYRTLEQALAK